MESTNEVNDRHRAHPNSDPPGNAIDCACADDESNHPFAPARPIADVDVDERVPVAVARLVDDFDPSIPLVPAFVLDHGTVATGDTNARRAIDGVAMREEMVHRDSHFPGHRETAPGIQQGKKKKRKRKKKKKTKRTNENNSNSNSNKIEALLRMETPRSMTDVRSFLGAANYFKSSCPGLSRVLSPLSKLLGGESPDFSWTDDCQRAVDETKALLRTEALPLPLQTNFDPTTEPFDVCTKATDDHVAASIVRDNRPIAYFGRKLSKSQRDYPTEDKELLAIVLALNEYRNTLFLGGSAFINVLTHHEDFRFHTIFTQRVNRWMDFLSEFDDLTVQPKPSPPPPPQKNSKNSKNNKILAVGNHAVVDRPYQNTSKNRRVAFKT